MKYEITMSCGHTETVELFGNANDRERKIEYLKTCKCHECEAAEKAAKLARFNSDNALPALTGSEKQVNWADSLREKRFNEVDEFAAKRKAQNAKVLEAHPELTEKCEEANANLDAEVAKIKSWLSTKTDARFWIDNRDQLLGNLTRAYAAEWNK